MVERVTRVEDVGGGRWEVEGIYSNLLPNDKKELLG
jgi:hypothetical protein